jgi:hypothetical protein
VYHTVALPFTLKSILRKKKNYKNSNISACKNDNQGCNPKEKEISKMLQYFIVIVTHKYWSVGLVVRSGGDPNNIRLFDRSLHDKDECLESKYMHTFNKYIVI